MLQIADSTLYEVKRSGKAQIVSAKYRIDGGNARV